MSEEAERAAEARDAPAALGAWRRALEMLPADSRQHEMISAKVEDLGRKIDAAGGQAATGARPATGATGAGSSKSGASWNKSKSWIGVGVIGTLLWKFKFILVFLITKAKFLILGLTKAGTVISMLLSFGVYWAAWGWKFAVGFIASMYVHEMGHVAALRRYGIHATAPMFIPGLGALVRLKQSPANPREDARTGLAGPIWGTAAAIAAFGVFLATRHPYWEAIAHTGAWLNLFNLLPIWQLDGGRGFRALSRPQRWLATGAIGAAWLLTREGLLVLLGLAALARAFMKDSPDESDNTACAQYISLIAVLSAMCLIPLPENATR